MIEVTAKVLRLRHFALRTLERIQFVPPLLARVTLGVLFMSTGWGKVHSLDRVTAFFTELGIPAPGFHAVLVSWTELVGGALLLAGLFSRFAAVPLAVSMIVALITAKASEIHGLPDLFGTVEFTYLALLVWVAVSGAGSISLDFLLSRGRGVTIEPVVHTVAAPTWRNT
jgi:putative oxidoreductase